MSERIVIDSLTFAREAGALQGKLLIADLARVLDKLAGSAGYLSFRIEGRMGARNRPQLQLQLDGVLSVCCQRCLEGIDYPVEVRSVLEFVDDEELTQEEIVLCLISKREKLRFPPLPCCKVSRAKHSAFDLWSNLWPFNRTRNHRPSVACVAPTIF